MIYRLGRSWIHKDFHRLNTPRLRKYSFFIRRLLTRKISKDDPDVNTASFVHKKLIDHSTFSPLMLNG
jgi:hypothetical protein